MASTKRSSRTNTSRLELFRKNSVEKVSELSVPTHFRCPISLELMKDPVTLSTGITYDRESIEKWLQIGNSTCPVTKQSAKDGEELVPNHALRKMIQDWCVANLAFGIERIPTPKVPVTPFEVSELLSELSYACRRGEFPRCRKIVGKIKETMKESERNRETVRTSEAAQVLSASFRDLTSVNELSLSSDILSTLCGLFPLSENSCRHIASPRSLISVVDVLSAGDLTGRLSSVLVLKEILTSSNPERVYTIAMTEGLIEQLVKTIERPISPQTTKASLLAIYYLVSSSEKIAQRFANTGLIPLVLEMLVESNKSTTEKALAVLDAVLVTRRGKELACRHALTVPILVKRIVRVSDTATEFAVSALWRLIKGCSIGEGCLSEAIRVGVFQKLLLVLQVDCKVKTKGQVSELLKILNGSRENLECIQRLNFKGLKRPF